MRVREGEDGGQAGGWQWAVWVTVLLFTLYLISGAARFHIIDEVSLYSVTENLARRGAWDTDQIAWSQWVNSPAEVLGAWGQDGHVYSKKGVAPALAFLPVRWLARHLPGVGLLQTTFLANALITIATALLLAAIARRLGYSQRLGTALALVFGIATLAWPYATHLFGEPLSALSLAAGLWALVALQQERRLRYSLILGLALGVAVATSAAYALLLPFFALAWLATILRPPTSDLRPRTSDHRSPSSVLRHFLALALPLALTAGFLLWYNTMRFGSPFNTGYHFESGEGFNGPILAGLYGLLLSPYRGIFYHQPITILALIGFIPFWRRHRGLALLTAAVAVTLVLVFSKWWIWWGGFAWGPRFLVPLAPYLVLWTAPLLQRWWAWIVVGISALVQALAVSANYVLWEIELRGLYPTDWNDPLRYGAPATDNPLHSPVFGQIYLLARREWDAVLDFAWWQPGHVFWWVPALGLALIAAAAIALTLTHREKAPRARASGPGWLTKACMSVCRFLTPSPALPRNSLRSFQGREPSGPQGDLADQDGLPLSAARGEVGGGYADVRETKQSFINQPASDLGPRTSDLRPRTSDLGRWTLPLILLPFTFFALRAYAQDPHYGRAGQGYRAILSEVEASQRPEDTLVTVAPYHYHIPMNFYDGPLPILGFATQQPLRAETENLLKWAVARGGTIHLVTAGLPPADPANGVELWLNEHAYRADDRWFDDFRLLHYAAARPTQPLPVTATWGQPPCLELKEARISTQDAHPGQVISLALDWTRTGDLPPLHLFVQLLPPAQPPVAQYDSAFPSDQWPLGMVQTTRVGLWIPPDTPPGDYPLIVGWYDPATGQRLPVEGNDFLSLTSIQITGDPSSR